MSMKETIEVQERTIERLQEKIDVQAEAISNLRYEVKRYQTAVSGIRWLQVAAESEYQKSGFNP
jgi:uncharacterized protein YqkB